MKTLHLNPKEILWNIVFGAATKKKRGWQNLTLLYQFPNK
jgi:hypothetical protein